MRTFDQIPSMSRKVSRPLSLEMPAPVRMTMEGALMDVLHQQKMSFRNRVAIVTGHKGGIGRAIEESLREAGATVVGFDLPEVDLADLASLEAHVGRVVARQGGIDILVNNAGVTGANKTVWEMDLGDWRNVMRINLDGPFICCKAVVPAMIANKYGRIVNIASIAGKEGNPNAAHYSASKAGVIALTKSLGKELAQHDILVNAVTPAAAKTAIFDQMTQQHIDFMLAKIPKARFLLVQELAAMVAWLASEDCAFSTGAVFDISGGRATY
jgi:2-dehydro-3-deoxy-L-rhamnonate dehydrogenase (NAD+)